MDKNQRIILFAINIIAIIAIYCIFEETCIFPTSEVKIIIYTALIMMSFVSLMLEHYFSKPTDIVATNVAIILLLLPLKVLPEKLGQFYDMFLYYNIFLIFLAMFSLYLLDNNLSTEHWKNRVSSSIKNIVVYIGSSKLLFFILFLITIISFVNTQSNYFLVLMIYAVFVLSEIPQKIILSFSRNKNKKIKENSIGDIVAVESNNLLTVRVYQDSRKVKLFEQVEINFVNNEKLRRGIVIDDTYLEDERWIKVFLPNRLQGVERLIPFDRKANIVNSLLEQNREEENDFIGLVSKHSNISKLKFIYSPMLKISEGSLLEVEIGDEKVLYQVIEAITEIEHLRNKNNTGYIIGEAIQLGTWNEDKSLFEKYGWVPEINTPVYLASVGEVEIQLGGALEIGKIPNTNYPVLMNISESITHHMAILGITGTGKSVFTGNLVKQISSDITNVIIVDLTGEYKEKIDDLESMVSDERSKIIFECMEKIATEEAKYANQRNYVTIEDNEKTIKENFYNSIKEFLESEKNKVVFELPDITNKANILDYTKWFFWCLFQTAKTKNSFGKNVCVVLEEAHTIVPETNSMGVSDFASKATVNSIAQIALQGRKYNIGFYVIAQRTANVSKTILTQCNSIISFQELDKTSFDFLSNYFGQDMIGALPNLKKRQAIAVGKAFRSTIPLIFQVPEIVEETRENEEN